MRKRIVSLLLAAVLMLTWGSGAFARPQIKLGNEVLLEKYHYLIEGKRIGLITNQTGVNSQGKSLMDILAQDPTTKLVALYAPEHGLDGKAKAGEYVKSYTHPKLGIPVYSLYGETRMPTQDMLKGVDLLIFDIQDIGARTYTYISTLNYAMVAAQKYGKPILVLDRPNPVGGTIVEGPVLEDKFKSFVGVDNLPMAHGMTIGELALYFNRNIGAQLTVVPMEGYTRQMIWQDTGLTWIPTSPNIPDLQSVFGYMATGLGEGTGISQADKFKWIGGKGIDAEKFANLLNGAGLPGVKFIPEQKGEAGGVRLEITDYHTFNPAKTGIYALAYARILSHFPVPKSGQTIVMFDKIMGTDKIGKYLEQNLTPQQIVANYSKDLEAFKKVRQKYLIYGDKPYQLPVRLPGNSKEIMVFVDNKPVNFDVSPYLTANGRVMVPIRAIAEALGAQVHWTANNKTVKMVKGGTTIQLTMGSAVARVNGQIKTMDAQPILKQGRTMIPVRYVAEFFQASVHWDSQTRTVIINN